MLSMFPDSLQKDSLDKITPDHGTVRKAFFFDTRVLPVGSPKSMTTPHGPARELPSRKKPSRNLSRWIIPSAKWQVDRCSRREGVQEVRYAPDTVLRLTRLACRNNTHLGMPKSTFWGTILRDSREKGGCNICLHELSCNYTYVEHRSHVATVACMSCFRVCI